ncbi:MAG TPA: LytR family transcriptional regulator [Propionibacterium sp.]|nr:LytR family transcriptional regulator [Propionibacterium sp.]
MARWSDRDDAYEAAHAGDPGPDQPSAPGRRVIEYEEPTPPRSFGASLGWAVAGTIVPGLGLTRTRWRVFGWVMFGLAVALLVAGGALARLAPTMALAALVLPNMLTVAWVAIVVFGVLWVGSIAATHLMLRPAEPRWWQRLLGSVVVGLLAAVVAVPSFAGAKAIHETSLLIDQVFGHHDGAPQDKDDEPFGTVTDPWANKPRLNVLVLGGDAGADRTGTRTDTVILASIDTRSGDTVLFSLPRQTQRIPFPAGSKLAEVFPNGFTSGRANDQAYALNAIYESVPQMAPDAIPAGVEDPGAEALKLGVGAALGLKVDYYAMVNMEGFVEFINALGGITVNINVPVPVGGKNPTVVGGRDGFPPDRWLVPGPNQHLNGEDALWFARGRYRTDDYARMSRQRCVIQAVVQQANPTNVLTNYEALAKAGREIVSSDVPNRRLPGMVDLALRVKDGTMTSVSFENDKDGFYTSNPDWELLRQQVQRALNPPPPTPSPSATPVETGTPQPTVQPTPAASGDPSASPSATPQAEPSSVVDECAYHPAPYPGEDG